MCRIRAILQDAAADNFQPVFKLIDSKFVLRVAEALRSGAYQGPDEVIDRALDILRERDEWLAANRQEIGAKIDRGLQELDRGEGIPEDETRRLSGALESTAGMKPKYVLAPQAARDLAQI